MEQPIQKRPVSRSKRHRTRRIVHRPNPITSGTDGNSAEKNEKKSAASHGRCPKCTAPFDFPAGQSTFDCPCCGMELTRSAPGPPPTAVTHQPSATTAPALQASPAAESEDVSLRLLRISSLANLVGGLIWCLTVIGAVIGIPMFSYGLWQLMSLAKMRQAAIDRHFPLLFKLALGDVVVGLFNGISFVVGIISLFQLASRQTT